MVAGSTCSGWSTRGKRRRHADPSMKPFLIFLFLVRYLRPDLLIHECTLQFDVNLLIMFLNHLYLITSLVVSPELFGIPIKRNRKYSIITNLTTATQFKPIANRKHMKIFSKNFM